MCQYLKKEAEFSFCVYFNLGVYRMLNIKSKFVLLLRYIRNRPPVSWYGVIRRKMRRKPDFYKSHFKHVIKLAAKAEKHTPLPLKISLVTPVYNATKKHLDDLLKSVLMQKNHSVELILSDDGSTSTETLLWFEKHKNIPHLLILRTDKNGGIARATNAGIDKSTGDWVGLIDHDDALAPFALSQISNALQEFPDCQFLYTDEVIADENLHPIDCYFKPAFDSVLLSGMNYINHFSVYRRDRLRRIGGLREGFQGSQDHDLVLRYTKDLLRSQILHLPYPGYLWRRNEGSFSVTHLNEAVDNARKALVEHYGVNNPGITARNAISPNLHRVRFDLAKKSWPLVSIVIPNMNSFELVSQVLKGVYEDTDYENKEVIVMDNGSTDQKVINLYEVYKQKYSNFQVHISVEDFNFSKAVNRGIGLALGDPILLLNNDIEILEPNWLKEMVSCLEYKNTGIVGAKLLYPSRNIQHVGVIAGMGGYAGHWFVNQPENSHGPMGRLWVRQSFSVVTGACFLITRDCFNTVGKFDEDVFPVAYNDVDYCLRATNMGINIVWTPFSCLIHHESASRGDDESAANIARFDRDKLNLLLRHKTDVLDDKAFNPWYSRSHSEPYPVKLKALPKAR